MHPHLCTIAGQERHPQGWLQLLLAKKLQNLAIEHRQSRLAQGSWGGDGS